VEIIKDIQQGSEEWHAMRLGFITASRFKDVIAGGQGKVRKAYMYQLAAEALTGEREESFSNQYMEWGTATEPQARSMYEFDTGNTVDAVAFVKWNDTNKIGISPDGLIGDDGGIEIKCPKTTTQIETYLSGKMPTSHKAQVQGSLWVTGREWWDFVSFDPRIDGAASFFCERIQRDEEYIENLEVKCLEFEVELLDVINILIKGK
jgi:putative phage-type endonuclease